MIGEKLGSFRLESILGTGAMGVVYRAMNETTQRPAAVKVISGEIAQRSKSYERFRREAEILQQFRHPGIVRFYALGRYKGTSYFAMEFVAGETLEQLLQRMGPLPWPEVVDLAIQLCDALHYAHEHGVVHRDLKPSNLMVTESRQLKLTDFGIAKDLDATALTATGRTLGTAAYMAPEQIRGTPEVSHKTDLYALGVVLYQMLTGRAPFEGASAVVLMHNHLTQPVPRPSAKLAEIPRALDDLIVKLMAKAPEDRPWDAAAVGMTLSELHDKAARGEKIAMVWAVDEAKPGTPTQAGTTASTKKAARGSKTSRRLAVPEFNRSTIEVGLLVLGLVAIIGFVAYMFTPPGAPYLYHQAERLMASKHRRDWIDASENYLDPLDRRFPDNPYRKTTREWRDRVPLDEASERANKLESPVHTRFNEPQSKAENEYLTFFKLAADASKQGDERAAVGFWEEMARQLKPDDAEERGWYLLALKRASDLKKGIADRRTMVAALLDQADRAERGGRPREALTIRANLVTRYGIYTDVHDFLERAGLKAPTPEPAPAPLPPAVPKDAPASETPAP